MTTKEDWEMIHHALIYYVIKREEYLKTINAGDREWDEVVEYEKLIKDIETYRL